MSSCEITDIFRSYRLQVFCLKLRVEESFNDEYDKDMLYAYL